MTPRGQGRRRGREEARWLLCDPQAWGALPWAFGVEWPTWLDTPSCPSCIYFDAAWKTPNPSPLQVGREGEALTLDSCVGTESWGLPGRQERSLCWLTKPGLMMSPGNLGLKGALRVWEEGGVSGKVGVPHPTVSPGQTGPLAPCWCGASQPGIWDDPSHNEGFEGPLDWERGLWPEWQLVSARGRRLVPPSHRQG